MPRFVILRHECPPGYVRPSHWDLMFEVDGRLRTWALDRLPGAWPLGPDEPHSPADQLAAAGEELDLHRIDYLAIEGQLDGDRGWVRRVEEGTYRVLEQTCDAWEVRMTGAQLSGLLRFERDATDARYWRLTWSSS